jgi:hypothetical protein
VAVNVHAYHRQQHDFNQAFNERERELRLEVPERLASNQQNQTGLNADCAPSIYGLLSRGQ